MYAQFGPDQQSAQSFPLAGGAGQLMWLTKMPIGIEVAAPSR